MDRAIKLLLLGIVILSSCRDKVLTNATVRASSPPTLPTDAGAPKTADPPTELTSTVSLASFQKGQLKECVDWILKVATSHPDAGAKLQEMIAVISKPDEKSGLIHVKKPCAEQFPDRLVLGKCTNGKGSPVVAIESYYDFQDVFVSDHKMQLCLKESSEWESISRDSPEYNRARLEADRRHLKKLEDSMEKQ